MQPSNEIAPPLNYVFVDFENVQAVDLSLFGTKAVSFTFLLGAKQTKLDVGLVEKFMAHASSVQLIRLASSGKNALDFALAYYAGQAAGLHPGSYIHIVSKDTGFDPLIEHLRSRHIRAHRHDSFATLSFSGTSKTTATLSVAAPAPAQPAPVKESMLRALEHLRKNVTNRPKKKKTLLSHLKSMIGKDATDAGANQLFQDLADADYLTIGDKDVVTYHL